jgi:hypothetical protein
MDELELLREMNSDVDVVDPLARARARRLLKEQIKSTSLSSSVSRIPRRPRASKIVAALVAALALLILAIQLILPPGSGGPNRAQATLGNLARVAEATGSLVLDPGSYLYVRSSAFVLRTTADISSSGDSWSFVVPVRREKWLASDGSGRILERYGTPRFVSRDDRLAWRSAGSPELLPSGDNEDAYYGLGVLAPRDLGVIPLDPSPLAALISAGGVATGSSDLSSDSLGVIAALVGEVPTSPELRSSVFLATAEIPGIESLGRVDDPTGRTGVGVGVVESGVRTELIFDTTTSELLSTSVVRVDAQGSPTQVLFEMTYQQRAIVPSTHARPR